MWSGASGTNGLNEIQHKGERISSGMQQIRVTLILDFLTWNRYFLMRLLPIEMNITGNIITNMNITGNIIKDMNITGNIIKNMNITGEVPSEK